MKHLQEQPDETMGGVNTPPSSGGFTTVSSSMQEADNYTRWILELFRPYMSRRVLEVGIGYGNFLPLMDQIDDYLGVDIDAEIIESASKARPDVEYCIGDMCDDSFADRIGHERFQTALCVNVLEHVPDDGLAVRNLLRVVKPGGYLLLFVPAFESLYTKLDELAGHLRRYRLDTLHAALPTEGTRVDKLEYFNPLGGVGWYAQKWVGHSDLESKALSTQVHIFDKYLLPVSRLFNPVTRRFFGQSVICAVKKI